MAYERGAGSADEVATIFGVAHRTLQRSIAPWQTLARRCAVAHCLLSAKPDSRGVANCPRRITGASRPGSVMQSQGEHV